MPQPVLSPPFRGPNHAPSLFMDKIFTSPYMVESYVKRLVLMRRNAVPYMPQPVLSPLFWGPNQIQWHIIVKIFNLGYGWMLASDTPIQTEGG